MRTKISVIGSVLLFLCLAFTQLGTAQTTAQAPPSASGSPAAPPPVVLHLVGIRAVLDKNLDAKKGKEGDPVIARPEVKIHVADGVDLETNSLLIGHVDAVQPSTGKSDSEIAVTFDKIQMKGGHQVPIKATILWIGQPPSLLDPAVVSAPADRTTPGVGVGAGMTGIPPTQGYQGSEIAGPPKRHRDPSSNAPAPTGIFSQSNAIPYVDFTSDIRKNESGSFSAKGRNVHIPGGTVFAFALAVLPSSGPNP